MEYNTRDYRAFGFCPSSTIPVFSRVFQNTGRCAKSNNPVIPSNLRCYPTSAWRDWEEPWTPFTRIGVSAEIWTRHLLHTNHNRYRFTPSRKATGSIPDEVIEFLNSPNPSSSTMALGSTQLLTSTRNLPEGKGRPARKTDNVAAICEPIV
jgi:hypothetical protein